MSDIFPGTSVLLVLSLPSPFLNNSLSKVSRGLYAVYFVSITTARPAVNGHHFAYGVFEDILSEGNLFYFPEFFLLLH